MPPFVSLDYIRSANGTRNRPRLAYTPDWETGCWNWNGTKYPNGYSKRRYKNRYACAHRIYYEELVGPVPKGLHLDHLCRNRGCVNPLHLEPVTQRENNRRGISRAVRMAVTDKTSAEQREAACRGVMRGDSIYSWGKRLDVADMNVRMWLKTRGYHFLPMPYKNTLRRDNV